MKTLIISLFTLVIIFILPSCQKEEGPGGAAQIVGNVLVKNYNNDFTHLISTSWAEEEDVYLMYGSDSIKSEKTLTTYNGAFWFEYLQKGDYSVYVYSRDSTFESPSKKVPIIVNVSISGKDETVVLPTITILKTPDGFAKIIGNVWVKDYNADFSRLISSYWAQDEKVYLIYGNDSIHSEKTETAYNGSFMFENLQVGEYTVFVYSKDSTLLAPSGKIPVFAKITITDVAEEVVVPTITIFN